MNNYPRVEVIHDGRHKPFRVLYEDNYASFHAKHFRTLAEARAHCAEVIQAISDRTWREVLPDVPDTTKS
jgi:hypothetical protein